jgi:hypothetical protein
MKNKATFLIILFFSMLSFPGWAQQKGGKGNTILRIERNDLIKITYGQLPPAVRKTLEESDYKTWSVVAVYRTKESDKFLLDLNDGLRTTAYWFTKLGELIDQPKEDPSLTVSLVQQ